MRSLNSWRGLWARKRPNRPPVSTRLVSPSRAGGFPLMVAAAEVSACVAQQLRANGRIRVCAEHNGARLAAWGPTDHIARRHVAGHRTRGPLFGRDPPLLIGLARVAGAERQNSPTFP